MKTLLVIAVSLFGCLLSMAAIGVKTNVTLVFDYPPEELSTNISFKLYHSTTLATPMTNWMVLTNIPGTLTNFTVPIQPGVHFYAATATNEFGESDFSNVARAQVTRSGGLSIRLGP